MNYGEEQHSTQDDSHHNEYSEAALTIKVKSIHICIHK